MMANINTKRKSLTTLDEKMAKKVKKVKNRKGQFHISNHPLLVRPRNLADLMEQDPKLSREQALTLAQSLKAQYKEQAKKLKSALRADAEAKLATGRYGLLGPQSANHERKEIQLQLMIPDVGSHKCHEHIARFFKELLPEDLTRKRDVLSDVLAVTELANIVASYLPESIPNMVINENDMNVYESSGSACLDFFQHILPARDRVAEKKNTYKPRRSVELFPLMEAAFMENADTALKLFFHLGAVREGKSDNYNFYHACMWLYEKQPATLLANLHLVPDVVYFKALLEILVRATEGVEDTYRRDVAIQNKIRSSAKKLRFTPPSKLVCAQRVLQLYDADPKYRALHTLVATIFATALTKDLKAVEDAARTQTYARISLAAKWCPSIQSSYDKRTLVCEAIATRVFPMTLFGDEVTPRQHRSRALPRLRKLLSRLREYNRIPERLMSQQRWSEIKYSGVPSVCMHNHNSHFRLHDGERFSSYLEDVKSNKSSIKSQSVLPDQLLLRGVHGSEDEKSVANLQWSAMVAQLKQACPAVLRDTVAILDPCMDVSVALSLLFAELNSGFYQNHILSFCASPKLYKINGEDLAARYNCAKRVECQMLQVEGVWDMLLEKARVKPSSCPSRIFIFSCMEFTSVSRGGTKWPEYEEKFAKLGLQIPEVVHWNARATRGSPAVKTENKTCTVSGFSPNTLKTLLKTGDLTNPGMTMLECLARPVFDKLTVVRGAGQAADVFRAVLGQELQVTQQSASNKAIQCNTP